MMPSKSLIISRSLVSPFPGSFCPRVYTNYTSSTFSKHNSSFINSSKNSTSYFLSRREPKEQDPFLLSQTKQWILARRGTSEGMTGKSCLGGMSGDGDRGEKDKGLGLRFRSFATGEEYRKEMVKADILPPRHGADKREGHIGLLLNFQGQNKILFSTATHTEIMQSLADPKYWQENQMTSLTDIEGNNKIQFASRTCALNKKEELTGDFHKVIPSDSTTTGEFIKKVEEEIIKRNNNGDPFL